MEKNNIGTTLSICGAIAISVGIIYIVDGLSEDTSINTDKWGTYGDFVGGVIGTVFALLGTLMMFSTFRLQRELTDETNRIQQEIASNAENHQQQLAELQRFNSLFFELLNLLEQQRETIRKYRLEGMDIENEDFLEYSMHRFQKSFIASKEYGRNLRKAREKYLKFYLSNANILAPYFRLLYRLIELIDQSDITDVDKWRYLKIIRAKLSEAELFFIRYNCLTEYGTNMIEYVNKYRLLKHLPILSILGFQHFKNIIDSAVALYLNTLLYSVWKRIHNIDCGRETNSNAPIILFSSKRYVLYLYLQNTRGTMLQLVVNTQSGTTAPAYRALSNLNDDDLLQLLKNFLHEVYIYSNFEKYNLDNKPRLYARKSIYGSQVLLTAWIRAKSPLRLRHQAWDKPVA